jgi:predicted enzyme related to lactoylglutathione lyase
MANTFGTDILIQSPDPKAAAEFYVRQLGFSITAEKPMLELKGLHITLYIEQGPKLGPVLEVTVKDVAEARARLVKAGCKVVKDEPHFPRVYIQDQNGLIYNLTR